MQQPSARSRRRRPRWRLLCAVLSLVAATAGAVAVSGTSHAATPTGPLVVPGRGVWVAGHTGFVGFYRAYVDGRWTKVYCVSPGRPAPTRISFESLVRLPGTSLRMSREIAETLAAHGDARTTAQAEAVSQAVNEEMGNHAAVATRAKYLPAAVENLAVSFVGEARRRLGPYQLALHLNASPLPGQSGQATVMLRSATGGVAGPVTLTHSANVQLPSAVRTRSDGTASFGYRTTGVGTVHISATANDLPPTTLRVSLPNPSTQLMLSWSPTRTVHASASYRGAVEGFAHRYECTSACDGRPDVTLSACAPASSYSSRITFVLGADNHSIWFPASKARSCESWTGPVADGTTVTGAWHYLTPHGWTAGVDAAGSFTVDCPPVPPVAVALSYDCSAALLTITLGRQTDGRVTPMHNGTKHAMVLVASGALTARHDIAPGSDAAVYSAPITCGTHATTTIRAGVARSNGGYNYGQAVTVVLP